MARVKWELAPDAQDYPAAASYLSLLVADTALRDKLIDQLRDAPIVQYKAKDLLRASQLPLLPEDNAHVAEDLQKVRKRRPLSPILLVRGDLVGGFPLQVADGYHRICASYYVMENTDIPCRLIDLPATPRAGTSPAPARSRATAAAGIPAEGPARDVAVKVSQSRKAASRKAAARPAAARSAAARSAPVVVSTAPADAPPSGAN